jgi:hypothetical protein
MTISSPTTVRHIDIHIQAVSDLAETAASLYALGSRAKDAHANAEAKLSYARLLVRLSKFGDSPEAWKAKLQQIQDALRNLPSLDCETAPSPPRMFYTAMSR